MKLRLDIVRDVSVLVASGNISPANFAILKAGIRKLLMDGKNKIVLELPDSSNLATSVLRDLAHLNLLAAEMSGQILLAEIKPLTRAKIEAFSKPPVVVCHATRAEAIEFFHPKSMDEGTPSVSVPVALRPASISAAPGPVAPAPVPPTPLAPPAQAASAAPKFPTPAPTAAPAAKPAPAFDFTGAGIPASPASSAGTTPGSPKSDLRAREMGELGTLRKRLSEIEQENRILKEQLAKLVHVRRDPPDLDSWKEKVSRLERELADTITAAQAAQKK